MSLDEKARENIEATDRLLDVDEKRLLAAGRDRPDGMPLHDASASRAYYAAYQALACRAREAGFRFTDSDDKYYIHKTLPVDAVQWRILTSAQAENLAWLRDLRVQADYETEHVTLDEAGNAAKLARELLISLEVISP